jgi:hypothetical protein
MVVVTVTVDGVDTEIAAVTEMLVAAIVAVAEMLVAVIVAVAGMLVAVIVLINLPPMMLLLVFLPVTAFFK